MEHGLAAFFFAFPGFNAEYVPVRAYDLGYFHGFLLSFYDD